MCATCGCGSVHHHADDAGHRHAHAHPHQRPAGAARESRAARTIRLERSLLERNEKHARENRAWFAARRVAALNLVGAPGAGKTALLEATVRALRGSVPVSVVEGDQETERDAARVRAAGARAVQLNTGSGCHLEAHDVGHALEELDVAPGSLVVIENVGNLVCPALFDLGERAKVVVLSVTEGDDKPLKYPHMFRASRLLLLNKVDLLPHVSFDRERCEAHAREVNPHLEVMSLSATSGQGMDRWCAWLRQLLANEAAS